VLKQARRIHIVKMDAFSAEMNGRIFSFGKFFKLTDCLFGVLLGDASASMNRTIVAKSPRPPPDLYSILLSRSRALDKKTRISMR